MSNNINTTIAFNSIQDTVTDTAVSLVGFGFTQAEVDQASRIYVFINSNSLRVDWSGNTPSTTEGALVTTSIELVGNQNIQLFKMVREGASSAEIFVILEG